MELVLRLGAGPLDGPIHGLLDDGMGGQAPFQGWLELTAAIESARSRSHDPLGANQREQ